MIVNDPNLLEGGVTDLSFSARSDVSSRLRKNGNRKKVKAYGDNGQKQAEPLNLAAGPPFVNHPKLSHKKVGPAACGSPLTLEVPVTIKFRPISTPAHSTSKGLLHLSEQPIGVQSAAHLIQGKRDKGEEGPVAVEPIPSSTSSLKAFTRPDACLVHASPTKGLTNPETSPV